MCRLCNIYRAPGKGRIFSVGGKTWQVAGYSADMVSTDYYSTTDGGFFHQRTNSKGINVWFTQLNMLPVTSHQTVCSGSLYTVNVWSRHLPLYPLVIGCLGLLNIILLFAAVAIGIYCEYLKYSHSSWLNVIYVIKKCILYIILLRLNMVLYGLVNIYI